MKLKLSAPKVVTFWIAVALAGIGVLAKQGFLTGYADYGFWLVLAGYILLALATLLKNL